MSGSTTETFQIPMSVAEAYEAKFVPALFAEWAADLLDRVTLQPGQSVLDVACGTGIVARGAADRLGGTGRVVGLDLNEAMLTVARRIRPEIEWRQGDAAALPFPAESFDVVLCQAALMFFPDRQQVLREMGRVVRPGGTVAVHVPGRLGASEAYVAFHQVVSRHAGPEAVNLLSAYFVVGEPPELAALVESSGLTVTGLSSRIGHVKVASIDEFVATEIGSTPLVDRISEEDLGRITADARVALDRFRTADGRAALPIEGHVVLARRTSTEVS